ncbi:hypothetical protein [Methanolobus chelungpuianus]|uniref:Uncharacterized protein n=1 Tax=Methanolobus chelungpuianus TaxID=502115 RepID=A0AAE3L0V6_9EURY|nr:hypothetical protein [Methanolobus chelungpuianus]MCQ6962783.1 hypothetical protein [Methanolobus chelungpuianus]
MAVRFTISSGPFNVPIVQHVVITTGNSYTQARWYWEYVRSILFSHFPHFESTRSYIEDYKHDRESNTYHDNVLIFIDLEPAVLKEICEKHGGQYL